MRHLAILLLVFFFNSVLLSQDFSALTFNLRLDIPADSMNSWIHRKERGAELINNFSPDILFTQEGLCHQVKYLDSALINYERLGVGRDDGIEAGEFMTIHFKTDKYTLIKNGYFWLSETPEIPSLGWDAMCFRYVSWVVLEDKKSSKQILALNTHFDHAGIEARKNSAKLILDSISSLSKEHSIAVLFGGDLNALENDEPIEILASKLSDTYYGTSTKPYGPNYTFNDFGRNMDFSLRIDYFFTNNLLNVKNYETITDSWNEKYPSDHFPVYVELKYK